MEALEGFTAVDSVWRELVSALHHLATQIVCALLAQF